MADIICFGEMLIDFVPTITPTDLINAPAFQKAPGGAPANVAVALAKLGQKSGFIGKVGADSFGDFLIETIEKFGVDTQYTLRSPEAKTALAFVSLKSDGDRDFLFYRDPSADMLLEAKEINENYLSQAKILHFGSITLIDEPVASATKEAIRIAKKAGLFLSYDPNLRLALWKNEEHARDGIRSIWNYADFIKISESELEFLTGFQIDLENWKPELMVDKIQKEIKTNLWHDELKLLVVTLGSHGCLFIAKDFYDYVSGFKVEAIDATGAGDGFVGGILYKLSQDQKLFQDAEKLKQACFFANAVGALAATERGAMTGLPSLEKVENFLQNNPK